MTNARQLKDSLTELKYTRQKIALLRADSVRLFLLNAKLIVDLKKSRESAAYYESRWLTVEKLFRVRQRKHKLVIVPKNRLKYAFFDVLKVGAGYFIGKI